MRKTVCFTLLISFVFGCISHEKKMLKKYGEEPDWVKQTPQSPSYYHGVGMISKNIADYRKAATKAALDNLSNEISVKISSSSLLSTMETTENFKQEFSQNIHLNSQETLEGYELVGNWENEKTYYVIYRLSKATHRELKEKRKQLAMERAKTIHVSAQELKEQNNYKQALINETQALEILSPFLDEALNTQIDGRNVNLAVKITNDIKAIENDIEIHPAFTQKKIKVGQTFSTKELFATVTNKKGIPLSNLPVVFEHKAISVKKITCNSDSKGIAAVDLGKIKSKKTNQKITVSLDFNSVIKQATKNRLVRKIINYQSANHIQINLQVSPPNVYISGKEYLDGIARSSQINIHSSVQNSLLENGYEIANKQEEADLLLTYDIQSRKNQTTDRLVAVSSAGSITVTENGKIIFTYDIALKKGTHLTLDQALNEACKKISSAIKKRVIPQFSNQYFNY